MKVITFNSFFNFLEIFPLFIDSAGDIVIIVVMIKRLLIAIALISFTIIISGGCGAEQVSSTNGELSGGEMVFKAYCAKCHKINGKGGKKGPNLSKIGLKRDASFLDNWLKDPKSVRPKAKMPKPKLTDSERAELVEYLKTLQ